MKNLKPHFALTSTISLFLFLASCQKELSYTSGVPGVKISNQLWTLKNLDEITYRNGDIIPHITDSVKWAGLTTGAWCYYNNDPNNNSTYGKLYNWYAVNDPRGLAPEGWHIPSKDEWTSLINFLGGDAAAGGKNESYNFME